jgi:hypothetical protein
MNSFQSAITWSWGRLRFRPQRWSLVAATLVAVSSVAAPWRAEAAGRVALVLVGEDYVKLQKSIVGARRANDIAEALRAKGFDVIFSANPANSRARAALLDFSRQAKGADLAMAFLIGHVIAAGGQSYFLPVNTELGVATDLFSRGISIASVAQIAGQAKAGAVIVLMTTPNFETAVPGLDLRPENAAESPKSVVTVFSSSAKLPVSRIDAASEQAADSVIKALQQPAPAIADIVKAASLDVGSVFGSPAEASLAKPSPPVANVEPPPVAHAPPPPPPPVPEPASKPVAALGDAAVASPPIDETELGKMQRQHIQERLRDMSLYTGPIDSIMGPLTREAIMGYQRSKGAKVTGYLTPEQFDALLPDGK